MDFPRFVPKEENRKSVVEKTGPNYHTRNLFARRLYFDRIVSAYVAKSNGKGPRIKALRRVEHR